MKLLKKPNVVLDTNTILSGILFGGNSARLLDGILQKKFIVCTSQTLYDEVFDKLINKFHVDTGVIEKVSTILAYGEFYTPTISIDFPNDPDNAYLLELAESAHADYLVTGDKKHIVPLITWKSTHVINPISAMKILL